MATSIKLKVSKEDPTPTPEQLAAANAFAKDISRRKGLVNWQDKTVGDTIPKFVGNGMEAKLPPRTITDINQIPLSVKSLQWDDKMNVPYFEDDNGYIQYVHPNIFYSSRFNPNRGKPTDMLIAKK